MFRKGLMVTMLLCGLLAFIALMSDGAYGQTTTDVRFVSTLPASCSPTSSRQVLWYKYTVSGTGRGLYFCSASNTFTGPLGEGGGGGGGGDVSDGDTLTTGLTFPNTGLHILDTNGSHDVIVSTSENITGDRTINFNPNNANRTVTLQGDVTLPAGTAIGGSTGATDNAILRADGTGGGTLQSATNATLSDAGELTLNNATNQGLTIRNSGGLVGQLLRDSSTGGLNLSAATGDMGVGAGASAGNVVLSTANTSSTTKISTSQAANVVATIAGAASQTGNLLTLENDAGTDLATFNASGHLSAPKVNATTSVGLPRVTAFPGSPAAGDTVIITDDSAIGACDSSGGSARSLCQYNGSAWQSLGDGSGSATAAGSDTQLQRNNGGSFGGISGATSDGTNVTYGSANLRATLPRFTTGIADANGNESILTPATSSAVNEITVTNSATGNPVSIAATGGDTNISLNLTPKGTGTVNVSSGIVLSGSGAGQYFLGEGSAPSLVANHVGHYAASDVPAGGVAYVWGTNAASTGLMKATNSAGVQTVSHITAGTGVETALAANTNATDGIVTPNGTKTFTATTLDVEATGNVLTTVEELDLPAAGCNNATAGTFWNLFTSVQPTPICITGTNTQTAALEFPDTDGDYQMQTNWKLPATWSGAVDINFVWSTALTSGNVVLQYQTGCAANDESPDVTFNTVQTLTDAALGTANRLNTASATGITMTGCAAGEVFFLKVLRNRTHASDSLGAGTVRIHRATLTYRKAQ